MKQILVISGKGGTGKTVISGCLAVFLDNKVIVDADVDAANLYLLLHPKIKEVHKFIGGKLAEIDKEKCSQCGTCREICKFSAISKDFEIDPLFCEGCTICSYFCPESAIILKDRISGEFFISETKYGPLIHARLGIAQENSGKLVAKLRELAKNIAEENKDFIIIDGPPGVGCPVMASMTGVDLIIAVTEPTLSGIHDLERVVDLANHFKIPVKVIINKFDLNSQMSLQIEKSLKERKIEVIGKIPFSEEIVDSVKRQIPFLEYAKTYNKGLKVAENIEKIFYNALSSTF
ncbi:MAG: (4Fe-4S)-binding protein [Thermodesulfobacterium geofontis]|uniref:(4Fe-4S)-binding protein n=1 Tax=Thermodesulfobacterium geofontis TaxID=1295609 RepID=A0A2N7PQ74_9BACT|nr:MAG: (4Fe-4S)-binding protein [Thermodesulfobacterium geofontis]